MRLVVFHYHLLPGGVTQVITSSAIAALKYLPNIDGITLVSGKKNNSDNVIKNIRSKLDSTVLGKTEINYVTLPELDYISDMKNYPNPEALKQILNDHFAGALWWVHNYHLGKNPFFTEALLQIAEEYPEQKIVLQIHDFPEASRFNNLETLLKNVTLPLYPNTQNIKYVTINSRDRNYLTTAGIPKEMVFLLNNPVENLPLEETDRYRNNYSKIDKFLTKVSPSYIQGAPLLIYPVRTIRRKNVLEAGLLARCSRTPVNFIPTLPGVSKTETGYSQIIDDCFRENLIPGAAQAGLVLEPEGISFSNIMNAGKMIISSSVQEGFGYLFINSLQWRKPLFARNLDIVDDFKNIFSTEFSHFYKSVDIPLREKLRKQLKLEYNKKISELEIFLDKKIISNLQHQKNQILDENSIDFLYLSPLMQKYFLRELKDKGLLTETRKMNEGKLKKMENMLSTDTVPFENSIIKKFSLQNHAEEIKKIIYSLENGFRVPEFSNKNVNYNIISYFADFTSISLLYNPI